MNTRPSVLFMRSTGKEGSGRTEGGAEGRREESERAFVAIQYTFLTFGQHNSRHGRSLTRPAGGTFCPQRPGDVKHCPASFPSHTQHRRIVHFHCRRPDFINQALPNLLYAETIAGRRNNHTTPNAIVLTPLLFSFRERKRTRATCRSMFKPLNSFSVLAAIRHFLRIAFLPRHRYIGGRGIVFDRFLCLYLFLFVCLYLCFFVSI